MTYSTSPINPSDSNQYKYVPFTAFVSVVPAGSKRQEILASLESISTRLGQALNDDDGTDDYVFDVAKPVAFTPSFGNNPNRVTITGHASKLSSFTKTPVGTRLVVADNQELSGSTAGNASNRTPDADVISVARTLINKINTSSSSAGFNNCKVIKLEIAGFIFGIKGLTFPN